MSKSKSKVSFGLKASYACGDLGLNLFSMAVGSFITSYYTDSVLMGAAFVGTMMLVARCFDGISDIIMGIIIDHTNTKLGKARPWVLIAAVPCAVSLVLLFTVPSGLSTTGKMIYIYITYIVSQVVCGTAGNLAVSTLCTFMSPDLQVRAELAGARTLGSNIGSLVATSCTMMVVNAFGGGQKGYTMMAVTFGIAIIVLLFITGINCKEYKVEAAAVSEEKTAPKEAATPMGQAVKILLTSKYTWIVTGCFVFNWLGICTNSTAMVYYARDVLGNSGYITYLAFAISLPAIIVTAIGIVPKLTGMYGKRKMMMIGAGMQVLGFNGLIATDATTMAGFMTLMERRRSVPWSIAAGADLFLFNRNLKEDLEYMRSGVEEGIITKERLNEAVTRILALKAALGLHKPQEPLVLEETMKVLSCDEHIAWTKEIYDNAITLVKEEKGVLPLNPKKKRVLYCPIQEQVGYTGSAYSVKAGICEQIAAMLEKEGFEVTTFEPSPLHEGATPRCDSFTNSYDYIIYVANMSTKSNQTTVRIEWQQPMGSNCPSYVTCVPTIFISVENPYHLLDVPRVKTYINVYGATDISLEALMDKLMGRSKFKGKAPSDVFCGRWDTHL